MVESEHVTGHALYVRVERTEQANGLVERLAALEGTAVITAADEPPAWLDERRRKLVLTPGEAKGLEYQRVCVLDVGAAIEAFDGNVLDDRMPLRQESRRTAIDQLRVALSRATETLAVVNVEPDARKDLSTLALVGGAGRYNQNDIIARFGDETATPEERTSERIRRAEAIVEEDPDRAWEIASQTVAEMGAPDVPNGVWRTGRPAQARSVTSIPSSPRTSALITMKRMPPFSRFSSNSESEKGSPPIPIKPNRPPAFRAPPPARKRPCAIPPPIGECRPVMPIAPRMPPTPFTPAVPSSPRRKRRRRPPIPHRSRAAHPGAVSPATPPPPAPCPSAARTATSRASRSLSPFRPTQSTHRLAVQHPRYGHVSEPSRARSARSPSVYNLHN